MLEARAYISAHYYNINKSIIDHVCSIYDPGIHDADIEAIILDIIFKQ